MDSPLGPALANIFVGYHEEKLFSVITKLAVYFRFADDTLALFQNEKESKEYLIKLNGIHRSLEITTEKEKNIPVCLHFLEVYLEHTKAGYETCTYRKPTFIGQNMRWEFFTPHKHNISLISILVHRALVICCKNRIKVLRNLPN